MKFVRWTLGFVTVLVFCCSRPAVSLEVTLDSGAGSTTLTDDDLDGIIDFDLTVGGIFAARGRVFEQLQANTTIVSMTTTPPDTEAVFHNVGMADATFTVTINSTAFAPIGPPLGWAVFYNGRADDAMAAAVNIPSHSVQALINAGALALTTVSGTAIVAADEIDLMAMGVNPSDNATDVRVVFSFTAGPDDEILLPDNNGVDGNAIQVSVFNQQFKCVDKMNTYSRKVVDKAQKSDAKCVTAGVKADGADETLCVDDPNEAKTEKAEDKLLEKFDEFCAANVPPWGVNAERCCDGGANDGAVCLTDLGCPGGACVRGACISAAAEQAANTTTHDVFGAAVNVTDGDAIGNCQKKVTQKVGKLLVERWKIFRKCKKDNFDSISSSADLVTSCLGPPQPDPNLKVAKRVTKLTDEVAKCVTSGVTPVGASFPGKCSGAADLAFASCVSERVSCRFCEGINAADGINPPLNCDLFDDGAADASCP